MAINGIAAKYRGRKACGGSDFMHAVGVLDNLLAPEEFGKPYVYQLQQDDGTVIEGIQKWRAVIRECQLADGQWFETGRKVYWDWPATVNDDGEFDAVFDRLVPNGLGLDDLEAGVFVYETKEGKSGRRFSTIKPA